MGDDEHIEFLTRAYGMFAVSNPLHPDVFPSVRKFEAEVIQMCASICCTSILILVPLLLPLPYFAGSAQSIHFMSSSCSLLSLSLSLSALSIPEIFSCSFPPSIP